jgi:hypothetical protein
MQQFRDPWNRFASTGRIEDYISYRKHFESFVRPAATEPPDVSAGIAISKAELAAQLAQLQAEREWPGASV